MEVRLKTEIILNNRGKSFTKLNCIDFIKSIRASYSFKVKLHTNRSSTSCYPSALT